MATTMFFSAAALGVATPFSARRSAPRMAADAVRATPNGVFNTANYREAEALSQRLVDLKQTDKPQRVAIIGGGLSGLACAKYLADAGHVPIVLEARKVLGGKVSAWQDADGDWIETGLHIFFGAYPNMMNLFSELGIHDRLQWKAHRMSFAMRERPGQFTSFEFTPGVPAPFGMALAILQNTEMLTVEEKLRMVPALLPMLVEGQSFIDAQDELSVLDFMRKYGMPERINEEIFIAMGKARARNSAQFGAIPAQFSDASYALAGARLHRPRQALDDRRAHRDEPLPQRGRWASDGLPGRQPARAAVRADEGAHREPRRRGAHRGAPRGF